jgi:rhodanese-related sulfurtransferase
LKHLNLIEPNIKDISSAIFHEDFKVHPERYDFIDVRPQTVYAEGHAEGSRNIPLHQMYFQRKFLPKRGKTIVLICSGGIASGVAYGYLEHYGFLNLRRIEGGIEAWRAAGLPVAVSPPSPQ